MRVLSSNYVEAAKLQYLGYFITGVFIFSNSYSFLFHPTQYIKLTSGCQM
jgi:hypothetical protein